MGLSIYLYKTKYQPETEVGFQLPKAFKEIEIFYRNKSYCLDSWMMQLYTKKIVEEQEEFNRINLQLTKDDLEDLLYELENRHLPNAYFKLRDGQHDPEVIAMLNEEVESCLKMTNIALTELENDYTIYYQNSW